MANDRRRVVGFFLGPLSFCSFCSFCSVCSVCSVCSAICCRRRGSEIESPSVGDAKLIVALFFLSLSVRTSLISAIDDRIRLTLPKVNIEAPATSIQGTSLSYRLSSNATETPVHVTANSRMELRQKLIIVAFVSESCEGLKRETAKLKAWQNRKHDSRVEEAASESLNGYNRTGTRARTTRSVRRRYTQRR